MIAAVIDCSALVDLLAEGGSAAIRENEELGDCLLAAPQLIDPEFLSAMRKLVLRRPELNRRIGRIVLEYGDLRITRFEHDPLFESAWAWRDELTPYDAMYVALARMLEIPLVTSDERLAVAAERRCGVRRLRELVPG